MAFLRIISKAFGGVDPTKQKMDFIEAASAGSLQGVCDALKAGVHVDATVITGSFDNEMLSWLIGTGPQPMEEVLLERSTNKSHEGIRPGLDDLDSVLQTLYSYKLSNIDTKWRNIGHQLGLSTQELSHIGANYRQQECLREALILWLRGDGPVPTWEGLVDALKTHTVKEYQLAKTVKENYCDAKVKYSDYLRRFYRNLAPQRMFQWPELPHYEFVTLAMIKQERVTFSQKMDKFVQSTLHGNIDDILRQKEEIDLEHMFQKHEANHKVVLIEGAPGAGKTMLIWHICREWGRNRLFTQFSVIVLATLRDLADQEVKSLTDVLSITCENPEDAQKVSFKMKACHGRGVLFLLDGWDELPKEQQKNEKLFFHTLIEKPEMLSLDEAAIIVTSRPVSSGDLRKFVSLRVEIVGFTSSNIKKYFEACLKSEEHSKELGNLLQILEDNPLIENICYLPLNAAIVVYLFCACSYVLPSTYHELFQLLVHHCILRYAEKSSVNLEHQYLIFEKFPEKIRKPFEQICKLAYLATKKNVITFLSDTLQSFEVTEPLNHLGLMQSVKTLNVHGRATTYHYFLHLSLQEFLAAYHISKMTPDTRQVEVFKDLLNDHRFSAVFGFYAGFTKLRNEGIRDVVAEIVQREKKEKSEEKPLLVSLINWVYEAQDLELCHFVQQELTRDQSGKANWENGVLDLSYTSLKPSDTLSVGYFLSTVGTTVGRCFYVNLSCCSIEDHHIKFLVKGLSHHQSMSKAHVEINLSMNCIHTEGLEYITDFIKKSTTIKALNLGRNKPGRNKLSHSNVCQLMEALTDNSSLTKLDISESYLELTGEAGVSLQTMLKRNKSLLSLDISHSRISCDCIANGLVQNNGLKTLYMKYCNVTAEELTRMSEAIQRSKLEELSIGPLEDDCIKPLTNALSSLRSLTLRGTKVTDKGLRILGDALQENNSLLELSLSDFPSVTSEGLKTLGEQLKKNQTLEVLGLRLIGRITPDSLKYFVTCLQQNSTLKLLALLEKHVEEVKETVCNINKRRQPPLKLETFGNLHMPIILMEPESLSVVAGTTVVFKVKATGRGLQFQWQKNHIDLCEDGRYCNTDTDTLRIVEVEKDDEGLYRCFVEDDEGKNFSADALLTITGSNDVQTQDHTDTQDSAQQQDVDHYLSICEQVISEHGEMEQTIMHCIFLGAAGVGKSSLMKQLLHLKLDPIRTSTQIAEKSVRVEVRDVKTAVAQVSGLDWQIMEDPTTQAYGLMGEILTKQKEESKEKNYLAAHETGEQASEQKDVSLLEETGTPAPERIDKMDTQASGQIGQLSIKQEKVLQEENHTTVGSSGKQVLEQPGQVFEQQERIVIDNGSQITGSPANILDSSEQAASKSQSSQFSRIEFYKQVLKEKGVSGLKQHITDPWTLYLTDSGGQPEFQELLPALVVGPCIFIIVFPLDKDMTKEYKVEYMRPDEQKCMKCYTSSFTLQDDLMRSLASIASTKYKDRNGNEVKPRVLFVATFIDNVSQNDFQTKLDDIEALVKMTDVHHQNMIVYASNTQMVFTINNISEEADKDAQKIRDAFRKIARYFKVPTPYPWLIFSILIQHEYGSDNSVISYEECFKLAQECGIHSKMDFEAALRFLHKQTGILQYYKEPSELRQIVIRNPQHLFSRVNHLVEKTFVFEATPFVKCIDDFKKGIFNKEDYVTLTRESSLLTPSMLLKLLEHLHVVVALVADERYFMPCAIGHLDDASSSDRTQSATIPPLLVTFQSGYCPKGLFGALVACIANKQVANCTLSLDESEIHRNQICFRMGLHKLLLRFNPIYIYIEIIPKNRDSILSTELCTLCNSVRKLTENNITEACRTLRYSDHKLSFSCQCSQKETFHPAELRKSTDGGHFFWCSQSKEEANVDPECHMWLAEPTILEIVPKEQSVPVGAKEMKFSVKATGEGLQFQWKKDFKKLHDSSKYRGTNTDTLHIKDVEKSDKGCYQCLVKNNKGEVSTEAEISVGHNWKQLTIKNGIVTFLLLVLLGIVTGMWLLLGSEKQAHKTDIVGSPFKLDDPPTLDALLHFPVTNGRIDIAAEIGPDYEKFGTVLLEDKKGNKVENIKVSERGDPVDITVKILKQWLQGKGKKPVTWLAFVKYLRDIDLNVLADNIESSLSKHNRNREPDRGRAISEL